MYHGATEIRAAHVGRFINETDKGKHHQVLNDDSATRLRDLRCDSAGPRSRGFECRMHGAVAVEAVN